MIQTECVFGRSNTTQYYEFRGDCCWLFSGAHANVFWIQKKTNEGNKHVLATGEFECKFSFFVFLLLSHEWMWVKMVGLLPIFPVFSSLNACSSIFQRPNGCNSILIIITVIAISWLVFAISFNVQSANPPLHARTQTHSTKRNAKHDNVFHHNPILFVCAVRAVCMFMCVLTILCSNGYGVIYFQSIEIYRKQNQP